MARGCSCHDHKEGTDRWQEDGERFVAAPPRKPRPPPSLSPYGVVTSDPIELVRYKLGQRSRKNNALSMVSKAAVATLN